MLSLWRVYTCMYVYAHVHRSESVVLHKYTILRVYCLYMYMWTTICTHEHYEYNVSVHVHVCVYIVCTHNTLVCMYRSCSSVPTCVFTTTRVVRIHYVRLKKAHVHIHVRIMYMCTGTSQCTCTYSASSANYCVALCRVR